MLPGKICLNCGLPQHFLYECRKVNLLCITNSLWKELSNDSENHILIRIIEDKIGYNVLAQGSVCYKLTNCAVIIQLSIWQYFSATDTGPKLFRITMQYVYWYALYSTNTAEAAYWCARWDDGFHCTLKYAKICQYAGRHPYRFR